MEPSTFEPHWTAESESVSWEGFARFWDLDLAEAEETSTAAPPPPHHWTFEPSLCSWAGFAHFWRLPEEHGETEPSGDEIQEPEKQPALKPHPFNLVEWNKKSGSKKRKRRSRSVFWTGPPKKKPKMSKTKAPEEPMTSNSTQISGGIEAEAEELGADEGLLDFVFSSGRGSRRLVFPFHDASTGRRAECVRCGLRFAQLHSLKTHIALEHFGLRFHCLQQGCDETFLSKYRQRRHFLGSHRGKVGRPPNKAATTEKPASPPLVVETGAAEEQPPSPAKPPAEMNEIARILKQEALATSVQPSLAVSVLAASEALLPLTPPPVESPTKQSDTSEPSAVTSEPSSASGAKESSTQLVKRSFEVEGRTLMFLCHDEGSGRKFECSRCGKVLGSSRWLRDHIAHRHFGLRFACPTCPSTFTTSTNRDAHVKLKHKS